MNFKSLRIIIFFHRLFALVFAQVFLLEDFGISLQLISLKTLHPNFITTTF